VPSHSPKAALNHFNAQESQGNATPEKAHSNVANLFLLGTIPELKPKRECYWLELCGKVANEGHDGPRKADLENEQQSRQPELLIFGDHPDASPEALYFCGSLCFALVLAFGWARPLPNEVKPNDRQPSQNHPNESHPRNLVWSFNDYCGKQKTSGDSD
jgi:hypothetical protein